MAKATLIRNPAAIEKCTFCGEEYTCSQLGEWTAEHVLFCCRQCALEKLPCFIADSIDSYDVRNHEMTMVKIKQAFYKALFLRVRQ